MPLTLRKITIRVSKNYQKLSIFFKKIAIGNFKKKDNFWQFFWKICQVLGNFLTFKCQCPVGSVVDSHLSISSSTVAISVGLRSDSKACWVRRHRRSHQSHVCPHNGGVGGEIGKSVNLTCHIIVCMKNYWGKYIVVINNVHKTTLISNMVH